MKVTLNGKPYELDEGSSLADLVKNLDLEGKRFAIEINEDIVSRSRHAEHIIQANDQIEIVEAIGGG